MKNASVIFWLFLILSHSFSWAENVISPLGEQAESSLDALKKANQYSFDSGGIGILFSYGTKNGVSAKEIGDKFVEEIKRRGVKSRYFYYQTDRDGVAIEFHIGYSAMGPWNTNYAASQMSKIIARANAAQKIHGY
ncbi:MAG: hypothetical protein V3U84_10740 [Thiotrichaceae bacterium]